MQKIVFFLFRSFTWRNNLESLSHAATNGIIKLNVSHFTLELPL